MSLPRACCCITLFLLFTPGLCFSTFAEETSPNASSEEPSPGSGTERKQRPAAMAQGAAVLTATPAVTGHPRFARSLRHDTSAPLRAMPPLAPPPRSTPEMFPPRRLPKAMPGAGETSRPGIDPLLQAAGFAVGATGAALSPAVNFEGIGNREGVLPPDTNGAIGPNHYLQIVNLSFAVFDRSGSPLLGPLGINTLWQGFGGACETHNDGDPIVLYDRFADRWLISQFAVFADDGNHQCIAISQSGDPTGAYFRYDFLISATKMNDYPKIGVWPDGYYMSINQFTDFGWGGAGAVAFERQKMLQGLAAQMVYFDLYGVNPAYGGMLPSDMDGTIPPPAGSPNYFVEMDDDAWGWASDRLHVFKFHVDWADPASSSFSGPEVVDLTAAGAPFDSDLCAYSRNCIPQPGGTNVDALSDRLMYRLAYRNNDSSESLVMNHTVDVDGNDHAGVRWYEIRNPGGSPPTLFQAGTVSPTTDHRWMGSLAMDRVGDIALGYSVSGPETFPSIRYTGRLAGDAPGTMPQGEVTLIAGGGSQSHESGRWGDYSSMSLDPLDDCTFWYTQEYYATDSSARWQTRVGAFRFAGCTPAGGGILEGSVTDGGSGSPLRDVTVQAGPFVAVTDETGHYFVGLPAGAFAVSATLRGYYAAPAADVVIAAGNTTMQDFALTVRPKVTVHGTVRDGAGHGWPLYARVVVQGDTAHPLFTQPVTGEFSLELPDGEPTRLEVSSIFWGYGMGSRTITPSAGATEDFSLSLATSDGACWASGYDSDCILQPGGLVVGNVFDANTGTGLNNASVTNASRLSFATPDDAAVADGFYYSFFAAGTQTVTASNYFFAGDTRDVTVVADGTTQQDFSLTSGLLSASPNQWEITIEQGSVAQTTITLSNAGTGPADFKVLARRQSNPKPSANVPSFSSAPAGAEEGAPPSEEPAEQPVADRAKLPKDQQPQRTVSPAANYVDHQVLRSWSTPFWPWGIAVDDSNKVWVSSPAINWWGDNRLYEYTAEGAQTGRSHPYTWGAVNGPADGAFNWNSGRIWQMDVGKDNCIHEIDPATGVTTNRICPGFPISQRGLAYDPASDTWYVAGWNDLIIYHVDSAGNILEQTPIGPYTSGLAYNPDSKHLFVMEVWDAGYDWGYPVEVVVLDAANGYSEVERFRYNDIATFEGAGLEMACDGSLWAVDQWSAIVYQLETGETTSVCSAKVPWVTSQPEAGTVASSGSQPLQVTLDARVPGFNTAGTYEAALRVTNNTRQGQLFVPITMHVVGSPNAPVATADSYLAQGALGTVVTVAAPGVLANDTDPNSDNLTAVLLSGPAHGTLQLAADGSFTYTPRSALVATDRFTYQANDGTYASNVVTVSLEYTQPVPTLSTVGLNVDFSDYTVLLTGTGFTSSSLVRKDGVDREARILSDTQAKMRVDFNHEFPGIITVFNAAPGGGESNGRLIGVRLTSPNGGESWAAGATQNITWEHGGDPNAAASVNMFAHVGDSIYQVASGSAPMGSNGSGTFAWAIPATLPAGNYIAGVVGGDFADYSDGDFAITGTPTAITVASPNGGETIVGGTPTTISWSYTGSPGGLVDVWILRNGSSQYGQTAVPLGANGTGSLQWDLGFLTPGSGYRVQVTSESYGWIGDTSDGDFTVALGPAYALTVTRAGTGTGAVTSNPTGIDCGATCTASFASGAVVTLTATPASGSTFTGWSGACSGSGACSVTMDAAKNVTASFDALPPFDFGPPPAAKTITAGGSADFSIEVDGQPGFTGSVSFSCSAGVPSAATCSFNPASVTPAGGSASTVLTIATTARTTASSVRPLTVVFASLLLPLALLAAGRRRRRREIVFGLLLLAVATMAACGGGSAASTPPRQISGTAAGAYTITVSATSGTTTRTQTVTLVVN
jgi:hypothetical protein